jgi:hypothetical protein
MRTWLNVLGGLMILGPIGFCFYGATKGGDLVEGFKCAGSIAFGWFLIASYTALAMWLLLLTGCSTWPDCRECNPSAEYLREHYRFTQNGQWLNIYEDGKWIGAAKNEPK